VDSVDELQHRGEFDELDGSAGGKERARVRRSCDPHGPDTDFDREFNQRTPLSPLPMT
jgi:hypothetical protein